MDSRILSDQLKKPTGDTGREVAEMLNNSNQSLYDLAFEITNLEADQHLLEIGFGNGRHFPQYFDQEAELHITGVDFSRDMCNEARTHNADLIKEGKVEIQCTDSASLPFADHTFDLVVAINVVYFWDPPAPYIREIRRVLKDGAHFLIGFRPRNTVEHLEFTKHNFTLYEAGELLTLLSKHGFSEVQQKTLTREKNAMDGTKVMVDDSCLLVKKNNPKV
ncbi:MAG: class I SAM-dependent methyltransferase [Balneolaceae bacterium]|nr:class I SAM-dependent methyltransferase [Balneolaceae bacterium]